MTTHAPDDTVKVIQTLIKESESVLNDAPLHRRLLLKGAIIDAKDLVAELLGQPRIDTNKAAVEAICEEGRKL